MAQMTIAILKIIILLKIKKKQNKTKNKWCIYVGEANIYCIFNDQRFISTPYHTLWLSCIMYISQ